MLGLRLCSCGLEWGQACIQTSEVSMVATQRDSDSSRSRLGLGISRVGGTVELGCNGLVMEVRARVIS